MILIPFPYFPIYVFPVTEQSFYRKSSILSHMFTILLPCSCLGEVRVLCHSFTCTKSLFHPFSPFWEEKGGIHGWCSKDMNHAFAIPSVYIIVFRLCHSATSYCFIIFVIFFMIHPYKRSTVSYGSVSCISGNRRVCIHFLHPAACMILSINLSLM